MAVAQLLNCGLLVILIQHAGAVILVDRGNHNLSFVPGDVWSNVTTLDLSRNLFSQLETFPILTDLEKLVLNNNQLTGFPNLSNATHLFTLDLGDNMISYIDSTRLGIMVNLVNFILHGNRLASVPSLPPMVNGFNLGRNRFTSCPPAGIIAPLSTAVDLNANDLTDCSPDTYPPAPIVAAVYFGGNHLRKIPNLWPLRTTLESITIYHNDITHVAMDDLSYLHKLTHIWIHGNPLTHVINIPGLPSSLQYLYMSYTFQMCDYIQMKWINAVRKAGLMDVVTSGCFDGCFESDVDKAMFQQGNVIEFDSIDHVITNGELI